MKKCILALLLASILALAGCSTMLERDYLLLQPYQPVSSSAPASTSLRAENYQDVVDAVRLLVAQGAEQGVISLYNYSSSQDVEDTITRACLEVVQNDPLGAYSVDYIKHDYALIVSYYEVSLSLVYRRTAEQVSAITSVTGASALQQELKRTLSSFAPETTLRISHFTEDEAYIRALVEQVYYNSPSAAFGLPEVTLSIYPNTGLQRIVELKLSYAEAPEILQLRSQELLEYAADLASSSLAYENLFEILLTGFTPADTGFRRTAYDALINQTSDSEGLALACKLLCDQSGHPCIVVRGTLNDEPHFWNLIGDAENGYRHVDLYTGKDIWYDEDMTSTGYMWDAELYPAAPSPADLPTESPSEEN